MLKSIKTSFKHAPGALEYQTEPEPKLPGELLSTWELVMAFKWYRENRNDTQIAKYIDSDITTIKRFYTYAYCERLISRGFSFPEKETTAYTILKKDYESYITSVLSSKEEKPKLDIQSLIKNKAGEMFIKLESHLKDKEINWYEVANTLEIKPIHVQHILDIIDIEKQNINNPSLYDRLIADLERIKKNKNLLRKPRKSKVIKPEKIIGSLQYLKRSDPFKIESINPESIIGCKGLWVFNTQYKSITHYVSDGSSGITVNGTTLKGYNVEQSINKALRKPLEILPQILDKTTKQARKIINDLTTKGYNPNGRINKHMILLKIDR